MDNNKFAYSDEEDKCYGMAGVAVSLNVWDQNEALRLIDIDSADPVSFDPSFAVCLNPRMSAKVAWNELVRQFQLFTGIAISNVMCRWMVLKRQEVDQQMRLRMLDLAMNEGREECSLDEDEIRTIFDKTYNYLLSIYSTHQIDTAVRHFAAALRVRRSLSGTEVEELLQQCLRH